MPYLTTKKVALRSITEKGILIANEELQSPPLHVTIVGAKDDAKAAELFFSARAYPQIYKRTEWWDKREGPMPNPVVKYPEMQQAAAYVCTESRCSLPIFEPKKISQTIERFKTPSK